MNTNDTTTTRLSTLVRSRAGVLLQLGALLLGGCGAPTGGASLTEAPDAPSAMLPPAAPDEEPGDPSEPTEAERSEAAENFEALARANREPSIARTAINTPSLAEATEWEFRNRSGSVAPIGNGVTLALRDTYHNSHVTYGSRTYGINLVWSSTPAYTVSVRTLGGIAPRYGDLVALSVTGGGYVRYASRTYGINLVWSSTPVYEWRIDGGTVGATVFTNTRVRLLNTAAGSSGDNVVYCPRSWGINLAWASDCSVIPGVGRYRTSDYF